MLGGLGSKSSCMCRLRWCISEGDGSWAMVFCRGEGYSAAQVEELVRLATVITSMLRLTVEVGGRQVGGDRG